jgi:hypothetical protein
MPRIASTLLVLALVAGGLVALGLGSTATAKPTLRLASKHPLVIKGRGFKRAEPVAVTAVAAGNQRVDRVRASSAGGLTATFASADFDPCSALVVRARGASGSEAVLKTAQRECPPKL